MFYGKGPIPQIGRLPMFGKKKLGLKGKEELKGKGPFLGTCQKKKKKREILQ